MEAEKKQKNQSFLTEKKKMQRVILARALAQGTPESVLIKELIRDVYQVERKIVKDTKGQMHILFL